MITHTHTIPVITVDGPTGSGKGTVSALLAQHFHWHLLDSGAIYRVFALAALEENIPLSDENALAELATGLDIQFLPQTLKDNRILLAGCDVTQEIRRESIGAEASRVSRFPLVREALLHCQRAFRRHPGLVADGRDMGTIIFPDATLKIFLFASDEVRAQRRYEQLLSTHLSVNYEEILKELRVRDHRDQTRTVAPLKPAADAYSIDSTALSPAQVLAIVLDYYAQRMLSA